MRRLILALALFVSGCGHLNAAQASGLHHGLDAMTEAVDPAYDLATKGCNAREAVIVAREGTTEAEDRASVDAIRAECDHVFAAFEGIRQAQLVARVAVDAAVQSDGSDALVQALGAVDHVRRAWKALQQVLGLEHPQ